MALSNAITKVAFVWQIGYYFLLVVPFFTLFFVALQPWVQPTYLMPLKYQKEIDDFKLGINCPDMVVAIDKTIYAYRFCFDPINHELNFLPNVVFDRRKPVHFNYARATPKKKCSRCGSSFYLNKSLAINNWNTLSETIRNNLGYTHIAYGILQKGDGLVGEPDDKSHFGFYEDANANLTVSFKVLEEEI